MLEAGRIVEIGSHSELVAAGHRDTRLHATGIGASLAPGDGPPGAQIPSAAPGRVVSGQTGIVGEQLRQ